MQRLGNIFAYEISKHLSYQEIETETPLGIAKCKVPNNKIVLGTILRAGLPLHEGLLEYFDDANNAFVANFPLLWIGVKNNGRRLKMTVFGYFLCSFLSEEVKLIGD